MLTSRKERARGRKGKRARRGSASSSGSDLSEDMPTKPASKTSRNNDDDVNDDEVPNIFLGSDDEDVNGGGGGGEGDDMSSVSFESASTIYQKKRSSSASKPPHKVHKADLPSGKPAPSGSKSSKKTLAEACDANYAANQRNRDELMRVQKEWELYYDKTLTTIDKKEKEIERKTKEIEAANKKVNTLVARVASSSLKTQNALAKNRIQKNELQHATETIKDLKKRVNELKKENSELLARGTTTGSTTKLSKTDEIKAKAQSDIEVAKAKAAIEMQKRAHEVEAKQQMTNMKGQKYNYNTAGNGYQGMAGGGMSDMRQLAMPQQLGMNPMMASMMASMMQPMMQQPMMQQPVMQQQMVQQPMMQQQMATQGIAPQGHTLGQGGVPQGVPQGMTAQVTPQAATAPGHGSQFFADPAPGHLPGFPVPGSITMQPSDDNVSRMATPVEFGISSSTPGAPIRHHSRHTENVHPNELSANHNNASNAQGEKYSNPLAALADAAHEVGEW